jgi:hypothetical protein
MGYPYKETIFKNLQNRRELPDAILVTDLDEDTLIIFTATEPLIMFRRIYYKPNKREGVVFRDVASVQVW